MPAQNFLHKPRYTSIFAEDEINISNILDYFKNKANEEGRDVTVVN